MDTETEAEIGATIRGHAKEPARSRKLTAWLALCGVIGPVLYVLSFTVAGFMRPGYSPIHKAVSDLGLGPTAWFVNGAGILTWLLLTAWVVAFFRHTRSILPPAWRWACTLLLELPALGYAVASIFTEAPATLAIHSWVGANLGLFGPVLVFLVLGFALRTNERWRGWSTYSFVASALTALLVGVTVWAFLPGSRISAIRLEGLLERAAIIETGAWYVYAGWRIARDEFEDITRTASRAPA